MNAISDKIKTSIENGSWIRRMFEAGIQLKQQYGEEGVCDFSLGNPDLPPPAIVGETLREFAKHVDQPYSLGYMPNGGFEWARAAVANYLSHEQKVSLNSNDVMLSCGAAGALNATFKAILNPDDEVLTISPYFVEYNSYVSNHGGVLRPIPAIADTFAPDIAAIEKAISAKTRALLINSPNNPTGAIYGEKDLQGLAKVLGAASKKYGRPIYLIADEPYRFLAFDGAFVPPLLPIYPYAIVVGSFSKNLCLAGERLGYLALSPLFDDRSTLMAATILANRILGYVNPPVIGQQILKGAIGSQVDVNVYARRRKLMADVLSQAGYEFLLPKGAFYFFPKAPGGDDIAFVNALTEERVLAVPGRGFGGPGHFRLAFCVQDAVISRSLSGFKRARAKFA